MRIALVSRHVGLQPWAHTAVVRNKRGVVSPAIRAIAGLTLALLPALVGAQAGLFDVDHPMDGRGNFVRLTADTLFDRVIHAACAQELSTTTDQLIRFDGAAAVSEDQADTRARVTCGRAVLAFRKVPGSTGRPQLPLGQSWLAAAAESARLWIEAAPQDTVAGRMAGALAFMIDGVRAPAAPSIAPNAIGRAARPTDADTRPLAAAVRRTFASGNHDPVLLRACTALLVEQNEFEGATRCSNAALRQGGDSVWHLVRLAYIVARTGGSLQQVRALMDAAIVSAESPTDRAIVGWHLPYRAPGFFEDMQAAKSARDEPMLFFPDGERWLRAGAAERLQLFWNQMDRLGPWARTGDGVQYLYAHFFAVFHSGGDIRTCIIAARDWYAYCRPPFEVALPHGLQVSLLARPVRLWAPGSGRLVAVIPYGVSTKAWQNAEETDTVTLMVRSWETDSLPVTLSRFDLGTRKPGGAGDGGFLTGSLTLPLADRGPASWQLMVCRSGEGVIASVTSGLPELTGDSLVLSDLVLGPPALAVPWVRGTASDDSITVFPAATMGEGQTSLDLEVQVQSLADWPAVQGSIVVQRLASRTAPPERALSLTWQMPIEHGLHLIRRSIDTSRLSGGTYEMVFALRVPDRADTPAVVRQARFTIP
jgi:hypothetical protein